MKPLSVLALALATTLPTILVAQPKTESCKVSSGEYLGWAAERVQNRWVTLTFIPQLGGRLMQVEFNGHSYLFTNPKYRGKYISPDQAKGSWINYGGDKIWPMPEGEGDENHWVIQSTAIDDMPYRFETLSQGAHCSVRLTGQPDSITGMRIVRTVKLDADAPTIYFHAVMENATAHPITWSIQSVSQYDLSSHDNPADYNHDLWAFTPRNPNSRFPDGFHVRYGLAQDPAFSIDNDLFRLHWTWLANEVWLDSNAGWLAVVDKSSRYGMVERFDPQPHADYPGNTTVIFYQSGPTVSFDPSGKASIAGADPQESPYYMEAEINSPLVTLKPGESYGFDTTWNPVALDAQPIDVTSTGAILSPLTASETSGQLHLTGDFSVFTPGHLEAIVYNSGGLQIAREHLGLVDPATTVLLDRSIPRPQQAARIALKLIGDHGEDQGTLSVVKLPLPSTSHTP